MKVNIKKLDKDGKPSNDSKFWYYDTYCDICGKYIDANIPTIRMPDTNEKDICENCKH